MRRNQRICNFIANGNQGQFSGKSLVISLGIVLVIGVLLLGISKAEVGGNENVSLNSREIHVQSGTCVAAPSGLVSWWDGDSVSGTTAIDLNNKNNATMIAGINITVGKVGNAFGFNGSNYVESINNVGITGNAARTMVFWAKANILNNPTLVGHGPIGDFYALVYNFDWYVNAFGGGGSEWDTGVAADTNWHLHAIAYNGSHIDWYVDGAKLGTGANIVYGTNDGKFVIGQRADLGWVYLNGFVDEVQLYNRALTADEVLAINNSGTNGVCKGTALGLSIVYPTNTSYYNISSLNYTFTNAPVLGSCSYSINGGTTKVPITCGNNVTGLDVTEGSNTWTVYANNSDNVSQSSSVSFTIDRTPPSIFVNSPANGGYYNDTSILLNFTSSEGNVNFSYFNGTDNVTYGVSSCLGEPSGLLDWWDGDSVSGTVAKDLKGNNDATMYAGATTAVGKVGNAFSLDGTGFVQSDSYTGIYDAAPRTYAFWAKVNDATRYQVLLGQGNDGDFFTGMISNHYWFYTYCDQGQNINFDTGITPDTNWHFLAITFTGSHVEYYIDGVRTGTGMDVAALTHDHPFMMGIRTDAGQPRLQGMLDEVQLYNRALTADEVLAINNSGTNGVCKGGPIYGTFVEGMNNLTVYANDVAGNANSTKVTFTVDTARPRLTLLAPANGSYYGTKQNNLTFSFRASDNLLLAINCSLYVDNTLRANNGTFANNSIVNLTVGNPGSVFAEGLHSWQAVCQDYVGNRNYSVIRTLNITSAPPSISGVVYSPSDSDNLDPYANITINATVTDAISSVASVILQYYNSSTWANSTMFNTGGSVYQTNITLVGSEQNYTFNIRANNTLDNAGKSSNSVFDSHWDCSWSVSPNELDAIAGFGLDNKLVGNVIINNTGDPQYALQNCSLDFRAMYTLSEGRIFFDNTYYKPSSIYTISAKTNRTIAVNASFLSEIKEEPTVLSFDEVSSRSETRQRNVSTTIVSTSGGAYLYQKITSSPSLIYLTPNSFSLESYVRNLVGDGTDVNTAFDIRANWTLPSGFTVSGGNVTVSYDNLSDSTLQHNFINISLGSANLPDLSPGVKSVYLYAFGYNSSGDRIVHSNNRTTLVEQVNITLSCYNIADGITVPACGSLDGDYVAPVITVNTGGGGGGGAGGGAAQTRADYQLVRGKENEVIVKFKNPAVNSSMKNVNFSVSGDIAKYIEVIPSSITELAGGQEVEIRLRITSPTFITIGRQEITLSITGKTATGNYDEDRKIVVEVHELSGAEADTMLNESADFLKQLEELNISIESLKYLFNNSLNGIGNFDYEGVRANYQIIKQAFSDVKNTLSAVSELEKNIAVAKAKSIDVSEAERTMKLAVLALGREEYSTALSRAKEAQVAFAVETKGEFGSLVYYLENNTKEISIAAVLIVLLSFVTYKTTKLQLIRNKISNLKEEEKILVQLMKAVQRATFADKAMDLDEYEQAMLEYQKRMAETIEDLIDLESKRVNLLRFGGERSRLAAEKERIVEMIKELQTDYVQKGIMETSAYNLRLSSYTKRIGEIEERIATLEAEAAMGSKWNFFKGLFFRGGK